MKLAGRSPDMAMAVDIEPSVSDMPYIKMSKPPVHPYSKLTGFFLTGGGKSSETAVAVAAAGDSTTEAVVFWGTGGGGVGVTVVAV